MTGDDLPELYEGTGFQVRTHTCVRVCSCVYDSMIIMTDGAMIIIERL